MAFHWPITSPYLDPGVCAKSAGGHEARNLSGDLFVAIEKLLQVIPFALTVPQDISP